MMSQSSSQGRRIEFSLLIQRDNRLLSPEAKEPVSDCACRLQREGGRRLKGQLLAADWMIEAEHGGMQIEVGGRRLGFWRCIEVVTEDRMAELHHVDAQLVGAAGDRLELDQGAVGLDPLTDVVGDGAAAMLEVDLLARAVFPVN